MSDLVNIVVNGSPVSLGDWSKAKSAAAGELPVLNNAQLEAARRLGISEGDYGRSLLAQYYGIERVRGRAEKFASKLNQMLLGSPVAGRVVKLERRPGEQVWTADIGTQAGAASVQVPMELFDDVVDDPGNNLPYTKWLQTKMNSLVQRSLNLGDVA
ncbi:MAG: hypothetical protein ACYCPO_14825 [Acidobacteriaceae bacterium]